MGFWQGMYQGYQNVQARKELERERQDRKATIEEERAYQRQLWNEKVLHEQAMATIPLLVEQKKASNALAQQRAQLGGFLETRLSDVPEETRAGFINLAIQGPAYAEALIEAVQKVESPDRLGRRMTGPEILKMSRVFEQTLPEGMALEDWIKQAASMPVTTGSGIDFDATLERLFSGDLSLQDIQKTQMELMLASPSTTSIRPDFDLSVVLGGDPQTTIQLRNLAVDVATEQFQKDYAAVEQEASTLSGQAPSEEWKRRYEELGRIAAIKDAKEREAAIFNFYAPIILPKLAEQQPQYRAIFPEFFQTTPDAGIALTEDDLRYIGVQ